MRSILLASVALLLCQTFVGAEEDNPLRKVLEDEHALGADFWVYNDIAKAREIAKKNGKPIFVTFRCVPCKACESFDAEVAKGKEEIDALAREKFVSVRQVEMKGVDLSLFQFDHDLNWAAMFINADGTVYARYGTQSAEGPDAYNSVTGLVSTMKRVLEIHENYPANKSQLAGKRGRQKGYSTALEMPGMEKTDKLAQATTRKNCIHCHMIHDAENRHAQEQGAFTKNMLWRYPLPENVGLKIDADHGRKVASVTKDSAAQKAGLQVGEEVTHLNGQLIASIADIQWVLNGLPNEDIAIEVTGSKTGKSKLQLAAGWKQWDVSWRGSLWSVSPRLSVWMPELTAGEKRQRGVEQEKTALLVKWINNGRPAGKAAREAGLRTGDVVIAVDGKELPGGPQKLNLYLKINHKVGDELPVTVKRGDKEVELKIKLVE